MTAKGRDLESEVQDEDWYADYNECGSQSGLDLPFDTADERDAFTNASFGFTDCFRSRGWEIGEPVESDVGGFMRPGQMADVADGLLEAATADYADCWEASFGEKLEFLTEQQVAEHP